MNFEKRFKEVVCKRIGFDIENCSEPIICEDYEQIGDPGKIIKIVQIGDKGYGPEWTGGYRIWFEDKESDKRVYARIGQPSDPEIEEKKSWMFV